MAINPYDPIQHDPEVKRAIETAPPEPSKTIAARKGSLSGVLAGLAFVGWEILYAVVPSLTPDGVQALLAPVFTAYPKLAHLLGPAVIMALLEAARNYLKARQRAKRQME